MTRCSDTTLGCTRSQLAFASRTSIGSPRFSTKSGWRMFTRSRRAAWFTFRIPYGSITSLLTALAGASAVLTFQGPLLLASLGAALTGLTVHRWRHRV